MQRSEALEADGAASVGGVRIIEAVAAIDRWDRRRRGALRLAEGARNRADLALVADRTATSMR